MHYAQRVILGLAIIFASFILLWFASPDRTGIADPSPVVGLVFVAIFAVGFIVGSMGLLGMKDDYPALLSGLVLYFIVGALVALLLYMAAGGIGPNALADWGDPNFWIHWIRVGATWPLVLVQRADLFGYAVLDLT
jgi:hypothetical protein